MSPPTVVKSWQVTTLDNKQFVTAVLSDASWWIQFSAANGAVQVHLDPVAFGAIFEEVKATIAEVQNTVAICPVKHTVTLPGGSYTLACDMPNQHQSTFHHDPVTSIFWLAN